MKTQFSRRELYALGEPLGESATHAVAGRRIYGGGGGGSNPAAAEATGPGVTAQNTFGGKPMAYDQFKPVLDNAGGFSNTSPAPQSNPTVNPMTQTNAQQGIAGYAQPYVNTMLGATMQNMFDYDAEGNATGMKAYNPYSYNPADYVAGFSPLQQQAQQGIANLQAPGQGQQATDYANKAIQGLLGQQYNPQTSGYNNVNAPSLQNFQMGPAERVGAQNFGGQSAQDYMNPYMQNVVDIQQREAQRNADIAGTNRGAQAVKSGAFGGSRQAVMDAEAARNLATQKGDIQSQGLNTAYTNAQQQFNADQARQMQAQQANQNAGLTTGQNNLSALLGVQNLGAGQNMQSQLANQTAQQNANQLAAQQQQFGANYGMQGLQSALSGANTLGNLGTSNLNNQLGVLGAQQNAGLTQQQQQQNIINQGVNNYQTAQQYPTQQLNQMKNMLSGLPVTTTSTQNYQAAPTNLQNIMALGMGGYGLNQLMGGGSGGGSGGISGLLNSGASGIGSLLGSAGSGLGDMFNSAKGYFGFQEGGPVKSYAQGGVTSEENVRSIADFLPTPQLPKSFQMAQGRGDFDAQNALQQEMAERASLQRGLGSAFNQLPQGAQQNVIRAAGGGVIAFKNRGLVPELLGDAGGYNYPEDGATDGATEDMELGTDDNTARGGSLQDQAARRALATSDKIGALRYTPTPAKEQQELTQAYFKQLESLGGPNPYDPMLQSLKGRREAISGNMEQAKGLAALKAMKGMLQPGGAMRGLGNSADSFADSMEKAQAAKAAEERSIELMNFNLMDAQRKERSGNAKGAMEATAKAEKNKLDAVTAERAALQAQALVEARVAQSLRQTKGDGAAKEPKVAEQNYANILADLKATSKPKEGETPAQFNARLAREASKVAVAESKTSDFGPGRAGAAADAISVKLGAAESAALEKLGRNPDYREATPEMKTVMENKVKADAQRRVYFEASKAPETDGKGGNDYSNLWTNPSN
jgi:hypothetical protein